MKVWRRCLRGVRELYASCGRLFVLAVVTLLTALVLAVLLQEWPVAAMVGAMLLILGGFAYIDAGPEQAPELPAELAGMQWTEEERAKLRAQAEHVQMCTLNRIAASARTALGPFHDGREL